MNKLLVTAAVRQELSALEAALTDAEPLPAAQGCYLRGVLDGVEVLLGLTGNSSYLIRYHLGTEN